MNPGNLLLTRISQILLCLTRERNYIHKKPSDLITHACPNFNSGWDRRGSMYKTHQIQKLKCFLSRLAIVIAQSIETRCQVENEDVVGAAPTGDAPTTSEWSATLSPTKASLTLEVRLYFYWLCLIVVILFRQSVVEVMACMINHTPTFTCMWLFVLALISAKPINGAQEIDREM